MSNDQTKKPASVAFSTDDKEICEIVNAITGWHSHCLELVNSVMEVIKEKDELTFKLGDDGEEITVRGDKLSGMRLGLMLGRTAFEDLPFDLTEITRERAEALQAKARHTGTTH
jgi:hypothetical protein